MQEMRHKSDTVVESDHPEVLVGTDHGPTPVEYLLHAIAACLTAGIANIAAARGVELTKVTSTVEGDIDLLGILGLSDDSVRNGYQQIRVTFAIEATPTTRRCAASSSSPGAARPCTTRSPTRRPSSSTSSATDRAGRAPTMTSHRHRRDRCRPCRTGRQPAAHRGGPRARGARPGTGRRALAQRALGLAAAAVAELDDPPARLGVPRSRPGRLHDAGRLVALPRAVCRVVRRPGASRARRCSSCRGGLAVAIGSSRTGAPGEPGRWSSRPARTGVPTCRRAAGDRGRHREPAIATRLSCRREACS